MCPDFETVSLHTPRLNLSHLLIKMVASTRVYIGNLGSSGKKEEIEQEFSKCGPIKDVWIARNPPGFAFVVYNDTRDAEAAVRLLDGKRICGVRVKVELSHQEEERGGQRRMPGPRRGPGNRSSPPRGLSRGPSRGPPPRAPRGPEGRLDRGYSYPEDRDRRPPPVDRDRYSDRAPPQRYDSGYDSYRSTGYNRERAPPPTSTFDRYGDRYGDRYEDRFSSTTNGVDRYRDSYMDRSDRYGDRFSDRGGGSFGSRRSDLDGPIGSARLPPPRSPPRRVRSPPPRSWGPGRSRSPIRR